MSKLYSLFLIVLIALPNVALAIQTDEAKTFAITKVSVIPMDSERVLKNQTVIVKDGKIIALGSADKVKTPEGAIEIKGKNKFLIPGLFDMHVHLREENHLALYLANGVTTVQNLNGSPWHLKRREMVKEGKLLGPRIFTTGPTTSRMRVDTPEKAEKLVLDQKKAGYDSIKHYGSGTREGMTRETYDHLLKVAKREGMPVIGHAPRNMSFSAVLEERQNSIDHAEEIYYTYEPILKYYQPHVDFQFGRTSLEDYRKANPEFPKPEEIRPVLEKLAKEVKSSGLAFTPTLTAFETIWRNTNSEYEKMLKDEELKYIQPATRASWSPQSNRYRTGWADRLADVGKALKGSLELQKMMVKEFADEGVLVMTGTDAPLTFVYPGFTLHHELELFVGAGLTPFQALKAATITPAKFLKISDEVGTIAVGKRADLVLLDANPLDNIKNTRKISGVFANGRYLAKSDTDKMLAKIAAEYKPVWEGMQAFQVHLDKGEVKKALEAYKNSDKQSPELADYLEGAVNDIGYRYIRADDLDKAFEVLKLNTEYFPKAFNTWDSLAEVYMLKGEKDLAIKYYKKSLELNPNNNNAKDFIKKLEQEK